MALAIKKHNSITDAITDYTLTAEKLLNAVFHTFEKFSEDEREKPFEVAISDLKVLIGMTSDGNNELVFDALKEFQGVQSFRNFEYRDRGIKYFSGPLLTDLTIWKDNQNFASLTINPKVLEALKQKAGYTALELEIVEKFRTKTGYKLYQMWRRYFSLPNHEPPLPIPEDMEQMEKGILKKGLEELNAMLNTKYTHPSQLARTIQRGLDEIEKISKEKISVTIDKRTKEFSFRWIRPIQAKIYVEGIQMNPVQFDRFIVQIDSAVINMKDLKKEALRLSNHHGTFLDLELLKEIRKALEDFRKANRLF